MPCWPGTGTCTSHRPMSPLVLAPLRGSAGPADIGARGPEISTSGEPCVSLFARMSKKRSLLTALVALVVLAVAGTTVGYAAVSKNVTLSIDGKTREVHTLSGNVRDLLASQHIDLNSHDVVAPSLDSEIGDDSRIAVRYGKPLAVNLDGEKTTYWTTATTVRGALNQLGPAVLRCGLLEQPLGGHRPRGHGPADRDAEEADAEDRRCEEAEAQRQRDHRARRARQAPRRLRQERQGHAQARLLREGRRQGRLHQGHQEEGARRPREDRLRHGRARGRLDDQGRDQHRA